MIKDYLLYFSNNVYKDSLYIQLKRDYQIKDETRFIQDVEVLYKSKEPIVYIIHHISRYTKIWMDGYIYLPSKILLDVVNSILINSGLEELEYKKESGFIIGKITTKRPYLDGFHYQVDIKTKTVNCFSEDELEVNDKVVIIQEGISLDEKRYFLNYNLHGLLIDAYLLKENDLSISDSSKTIRVDEELEIGSDFFWMEERK